MIQKKIGIYKMIIGDQFYIGSSINLDKRFKSHISELRRGRKTNQKIQTQYNKIGNVKFDVLEYIDNESNLTSREQYYMDSLSPSLNKNRLTTQRGRRKLVCRVEISKED